MRRGFDTSANCANGSDQFREVIRRGGESESLSTRGQSNVPSREMIELRRGRLDSVRELGAMQRRAPLWISDDESLPRSGFQFNDDLEEAWLA